MSSAADEAQARLAAKARMRELEHALVTARAGGPVDASPPTRDEAMKLARRVDPGSSGASLGRGIGFIVAGIVALAMMLSGGFGGLGFFVPLAILIASGSLSDQIKMADRSRKASLIQLELEYLPLIIPIVFVSACAFAALGLCFTALVPTIDHMNLPIFLVVLPLGFVSATYFPLGHPVLAAISTANPLYHLAEGLRGLLLGDGPGYHLAGLAGLLTVMLGVLVPLDMRLLRKRVLGD